MSLPLRMKAFNTKHITDMNAFSPFHQAAPSIGLNEVKPENREKMHLGLILMLPPLPGLPAVGYVGSKNEGLGVAAESKTAYTTLFNKPFSFADVLLL